MFPIGDLEVSAAEGGIFDGLIINSNTGVPITWATDGNSATGSNVRSSPVPVFEFTEPTHITRYYIEGMACIQFFSDSGRKKVIKQFSQSSKGEWFDVDVENVMSIMASTCGSSVNRMLYEMDFKSPVPIEYLPVKNAKGKAVYPNVVLSWDNPSEEAFRTVVIKKDGEEIASLDNSPNTSSTFNVENLSPETSYEFELIAQYSDGVRSIGQTIIITTEKEPPEPIPAGDVIELSAKADYDRVDLAWRLPKSENLKHVNIYRETLNKTMFDRLLGVKSVSAAGNKIFETNGTYFNDLTVAAETKYEYTLTTQSLEGLESSGVSVTAITPKKPAPEMGGEETEADADGNYTFSWTSPTTGKVRVIIGGKEYKTVNAADLQITIPAVDMKFTIFGNPDVKLVAIDEEGNEGRPTSPPPVGGGNGGDGENGVGNVKLPFGVSDLVGSVFGFIGILSGFILLVLAIYLAPRIIAVIKKAAADNRLRG